MEMWLTYEGERLRLPITPTFEIELPFNNAQEVLSEVGTINLKGKPGLRSIEIESFFPSQPHDFIDFGGVVYDPYYYVQKIESWARDKNPIRFLITETPYNFEVLVGRFKAGEVDGSSDVSYTLSLTEYVRVAKKEYSIPIQERTVKQWEKFVRDAKKETGAKSEHELYQTPWAKAKSLTGEGENYKILDEALKQLKAAKRGEIMPERDRPSHSMPPGFLGKTTAAPKTTKKAKTMTVEATAYTPSPRENGGSKTTARGNPLTPYKYIAVDPKVIPYGTKVYIDEFKDSPYKGIFIADDCGGAIKGNKIDVLLPNSKEANKFGRKKNYTIKILG